MMVLCNISCLLTSFFFFHIEFKQFMEQGSKDYFTSLWNVNDFIMIMVYWIYFFMRLKTKDFSGDFILVKKLEYIDDHMELEIIIDQLEHVNNMTYL